MSDGIMVSAYVLNTILDRVDPMMREIPAVLTANDPEPLHRMRVASRRLRAAIRLLGPGAGIVDPRDFSRSVRSVTRGLGAARDLDVQRIWLESFKERCDSKERYGVARLLLRLSQAREKMQFRVARLLNDLTASRSFADIVRTLRGGRWEAETRVTAETGTDLLHAARFLGLQLESMLQHAACLSLPDAVEAQHRMRVEMKRLRYAMEVFAPLYDGGLGEYVLHAKKMQGLLGDLHDADVWICRLPEMEAAECRRTARYFGTTRPFAYLAAGYAAVLRDRMEQRPALYERAVSFWSELCGTGCWTDLRVLLVQPCRCIVEE